ncbi:MAG: hypothetical protein WCF84_22560, partial [Anaerolineae bacterium]
MREPTIRTTTTITASRVSSTTYYAGTVTIIMDNGARFVFAGFDGDRIFAAFISEPVAATPP